MSASDVNFALLGVLWFCLIAHVTCASDQSDGSLALRQCISNVDCGEKLACIDLKCQDPCPGPCHGNITCDIVDHVPYCSCKPGFSGSPFTGCQRASPGNCSTTGRKVYKVERFIKVNWFAAIVHCQSHGWRLATIDSKEENDLIKEEIRKTRIRNNRFWTSGTNYAHGDWIWMVSGMPLPESTDWEPGEPNNAGDEHCIEFYEKNGNGYMWNDRGCFDEIYPICESFE
ncbi:mannose binding [Homalodisca vitripennis]|nr:mannose binding [Homalodisca vitripennis]